MFSTSSSFATESQQPPLFYYIIILFGSQTVIHNLNGMTDFPATTALVDYKYTSVILGLNVVINGQTDWDP